METSISLRGYCSSLDSATCLQNIAKYQIELKFCIGLLKTSLLNVEGCLPKTCDSIF